MRLMIGCPVKSRDWILDRWFDHTEAALPVDVTPRYVFVGDPIIDNWTFKIINQRAPAATIVPVTEGNLGTGRRDWSNPQRIEHMVVLRNFMLAEVRALKPDLFLSLDSDILLHPNGISTLIDAIGQGWDAVGGKCYLDPGISCPNYAMLGRNGNLRRTDAEGGLFPVDVLMAVKMMSPAAYAINYRAAKSGEDEGWSRNCTEAGLKLAWDSRVINKHVLQPDRLDVIDKRVGF